VKKKCNPKQFWPDFPDTTGMIDAAALIRFGADHFLEALTDSDVNENTQNQKEEVNEHVCRKPQRRLVT
jgi:hypothetical protein